MILTKNSFYFLNIALRNRIELPFLNVLRCDTVPQSFLQHCNTVIFRFLDFELRNKVGILRESESLRQHNRITVVESSFYIELHDRAKS